MAPPNFSDVSKALNDLLNKDIPAGSQKLELNTLTANGVKFTVSGVKDNKSGAITSELKAKYTDKPHGIAITNSWNTSNVLGVTFEVSELCKGLKLELANSILPASGQKNVKANIEYKHQIFFSRASVDLFKGPTVSGDAVIGSSNGFFIGADSAYSVADAKITRFNTCVGYLSPEYSASVQAVNSFSAFSAGYFHKVRPGVEAGAKASWALKDTAVNVEIASKYDLDKDTYVKAKINNVGILGLGYTQTLRDGLKLSLGGLFDTTKFGENVHKVGMTINFDA